MRTWTLLAILAPALAPTLALAQELHPLADYKLGRATFTQQGKDVTWVLYRGDAQEMTGQMKARMVSLMYTPNGQWPNTSAPILKMTVSKMTVAGAGDVLDLSVLAVQKGPAGDAVYRSRAARCTVTLVRLDAQGAEGSGSCTGSFEGGPTVTKFTFAATP